jgi:hypothetical protein
MYLRHEAGHAFNYAYLLYRTARWRELFGPFFRRYRDEYRPVPFSRRHVRHIEGWYAQKHPDEDFAETFAVWLDRKTQWRKRYAAWGGAIRKLEYVDHITRALADTPPPRAQGRIDITTDEMEKTVEETLREYHVDETAIIADLPLDADLLDIFTPTHESMSAAADVLARHRRSLIDKVHDWTGVRRSLVRELVLAIELRLRELQLHASREQMLELTVYITALSMTFLTGKRRLRHPRSAR